MILAKIKKLDGTQLDHGNFQSEEAALAWFAPFMQSGVYGSELEFSIEFQELVPSQEELQEEKIAKGRAAREACEKVLDLISGYNLDRQLTFEQISVLQATFASAESALRAGRPSFAKSFITEIEPDGELVTQEMKDGALALLANY